MNKFLTFTFLILATSASCQEVTLGYVNSAAFSNNINCGIGEIFILPDSSTLKDLPPESVAVQTQLPTVPGESTTATDSFLTYPNPVSDVLYFQTSIDVKQISIYSLNGKLVNTTAVRSDHSIDVSSLRSGVYLLKSEQSKIPTIKIVKR